MGLVSHSTSILPLSSDSNACALPPTPLPSSASKEELQPQNGQIGGGTQESIQTLKKTGGQGPKKCPGVQGDAVVGPLPVWVVCCLELGPPGIYSIIQHRSIEHPTVCQAWCFPGVTVVSKTKPCPLRSLHSTWEKGNEQESNAPII